MKSLFFFQLVIFVCLVYICAFELDAEEVRFIPNIEEFAYNGHKYICINNSCWIHDPDCGCYGKIKGRIFLTPKDYHGKLIREVELWRPLNETLSE